MRKLVVGLFLFLILFITIPSVQATDYEYYFSGLGIRPVNGSIELGGNLDMLVPKVDFEDKLSIAVNQSFIDNNPNYLEFDYLNDDSEWVSYCAFVQGGNCMYGDELGTYIFADSADELNELDEVMFIHVDANGDTVVLSEIYKIPNTMGILEFSRYHSYDVSTNEFNINLTLKLDDLFVFIAIVTLMLSALISLFRVVMMAVFKVKTKIKEYSFLYYMFIYIVLIVLGLTLLNRVDFIAQMAPNIFGFVVYIAIFSSIESLISYKLIFKGFDRNQYIKYAVVSYVIILAVVLAFGLLWVA